ncbi:MAG: hypothetical protein L3V56_00515 [Candidatus Magnetoovum sp. WYHC-5]|nr:hypothetical protein [Candidatus Magnetoovum sp. WYHC-5]
MTKDPMHKKKNLYRFMKLKPDAKFSDVLRSFVSIKREAEKAEKIDFLLLNKAKKLLNPKVRFTLDFLYYTKDIFAYYIETQELEEFNIKDELKKFIDVPVLEREAYFDDTKSDDMSNYYGEIKYKDISVDAVDLYDDLNTYKFDISFDR